MINSGILPLTFVNPDDYDSLNIFDKLILKDVVGQIKEGSLIRIQTINGEIPANLNISSVEMNILLHGGKINWMRQGV